MSKKSNLGNMPDVIPKFLNFSDNIFKTTRCYKPKVLSFITNFDLPNAMILCIVSGYIS